MAKKKFAIINTGLALAVTCGGRFANVDCDFKTVRVGRSWLDRLEPFMADTVGTHDLVAVTVHELSEVDDQITANNAVGLYQVTSVTAYTTLYAAKEAVRFDGLMALLKMSDHTHETLLARAYGDKIADAANADEPSFVVIGLHALTPEQAKKAVSPKKPAAKKPASKAAPAPKPEPEPPTKEPEPKVAETGDGAIGEPAGEEPDKGKQTENGGGE